MTTEDDRPRRYLIATAIAHYPNAPEWDRPGLVAARAEVVDLFTGALGYEHVSDLGLDPTRAQLTARLRAFCRSSDRRPDDIVAVYIAGHGEVLDGTHEHVLLTADTDPADVADALPTAEIARKMLLDTPVRRVLLMFDTCYSGQGGNELTASAITSMTQRWGDERGAGLVVLTSAQPTEQAETGAFPRLLRKAVHGLPSAGYAPKVLPLDSVVQAMNDDATKPGFQTIGSSLTRLTGEVPAFLPNPRYDPRLTEVDLAIQCAAEWDAQAERRETELRTRLVTRAMGGHGTSGSWWFSGRRTALLDIAAWLSHVDIARPLLAVTAGPGSGKTAVLGLIATLTHADRRMTVPLQSLDLPSAAIPPPSAVDVAIYAQNLTTDQVFHAITSAARLRADTIGQLLDLLGEREAPFTVLIDALDEATDPEQLARRLVRPLSEHANGRLRLLVGTRPYLLELAGVAREDAIDLDAPRYADPEALANYIIRGLLEAADESPYRGVPGEVVRSVADAVAEASHPSFLVARIVSASLAAQAGIPDPHDPEWRRSLPRLPGEAMRRDLETRLGADAKKVRDLLRPLAFAEGQGLPWEDIWAAVASKVSGTGYGDEDLLWLRRRAGSYVVEAIEGGRSTYRLYHQALAEHLRDGTDKTAVHASIAAVLKARVPRAPDGTLDWGRAHPYVRRHLSTHAAHAGLIDEFIADADYLVYAEADPLLAALAKVTSEDGALICAIYRASAGLHRNLPPSRRRQLLATDAARFAATRHQRALSRTLPWPPRWATGQQSTIALRTTYPGHATSVRAVAFGTLDGRAVAVSAGDDAAVRVWDATTGVDVCSFAGHGDAVRAVAFGVLGGRPVVVSGSADETAQVWDAANGRSITVFAKHTNTVRAVAFGELAGSPVVISGSFDKTVRVWDAPTGDEIALMTGHTGGVEAVACGVLDGRLVVISGGLDGTVRVWDAATGKEIAVFAGHTDWVNALACGVLDGRPVVVSGGADETARVWDAATGKEIAVFAGHTDWVNALACGVLDGRPVVVSGGADETARVWDAATGKEIAVFAGHADWVNALAYGVLDERPVAVSGSDDRTVRVWDLDVLANTLRASAGHVAGITAVACGVLDSRPVVVSGSADETARVWDAATGKEVTVFTAHTDWVNAVAYGVLDDQPVVVSGSLDETARVWHAASGVEIAVFTGHTSGVNAVAYGTLEARPVAVSGGFDKTVRVWDPDTGEEVKVLTGHAGEVNALACGLLDGRSVVVSGSADETVRVWDTVTGEEITVFTAHGDKVNAVAYGVLDDRAVVVSGSDDNTARVWDAATGTEITVFAAHSDWVNAVACGVLAGRPVAISGSGDMTVRMWELRNGEECLTLDYHGLNLKTLAVGQAEEIVIAAGRDMAVLDRRAMS
ncbi:caspase family protein [Amycolatopsis sp. YIM 10]|uniref:caspase family protein n=1 Tax=Amycolatopsis sp. YIM 10 TaxID=2653857 RepID=UPI0012904E44|nr:caspase family protein [Amycolatopsis sp. YIM 10]QFU88458.1 WD domain, G-beta repeat [Amycolatopsis sp. YIM 10]